MVYQEVFKALIEVLDNSEKEKNICLEVKKPVVLQVSSFVTLILVLKAGQPASSGILSPAIPSGHVFANI